LNPSLSANWISITIKSLQNQWFAGFYVFQKSQNIQYLSICRCWIRWTWKTKKNLHRFWAKSVYNQVVHSLNILFGN